MKNPLDYLKEHWDISSDMIVTQLKGCFLRGMTKVSSNAILGKQNIELSKEEMPPHMHHSSITTNSGVQTLTGTSSTRKTKPVKNAVAYDMFYDDSMIGLDKNELDGVVDLFEVQDTGDSFITHNNMPNLDNFYAFVVEKAARVED